MLHYEHKQLFVKTVYYFWVSGLLFFIWNVFTGYLWVQNSDVANKVQHCQILLKFKLRSFFPFEYILGLLRKNDYKNLKVRIGLQNALFYSHV